MTTRIEILKRGTPLAQALPNAQFAEWHSRVLGATPERAWDALHELRWTDLRLTRPLMTIRMGAATRSLNRRLVEAPSPAAPVHEDPPHASVSGMIGKPWRIRPIVGPAMTGLDQLREFNEPGWLKFGMEWVLTPLPGGRTFVETATLCEATDAGARRRFAAYWALIRVFSGFIRRDILASMERKLR